MTTELKRKYKAKDFFFFRNSENGKQKVYLSEISQNSKIYFAYGINGSYPGEAYLFHLENGSTVLSPIINEKTGMAFCPGILGEEMKLCEVFQ